MSKRAKELFEQESRFSIRKYKIGVFSVLIGTVFLGGLVTSQTAYADVEQTENASQLHSDNSLNETGSTELASQGESQATSSELTVSEGKSEVEVGSAGTNRAAESTTTSPAVIERDLNNQIPQEKTALSVETSQKLEQDQNYYEAARFDADKVVEVTNVTTKGKANQTVDLTSQLSKVKNLQNATIYMEFKPDQNQSGLYTLFSASSNSNRNSYYAVGIRNGDTPYVEAPNKGVQQFGALLQGGKIVAGEWNALAVTMNQTDSSTGRIDVYLNGQYVFHSSKSGKFLSDFTDLTNMQLGAMKRGSSMTWGGNVDFRNLTIYDKALTASEVAERSKLFDKLPSDVVDEDGKVLTEGEIVLNKASYSPTAGFRIPALLKTADGTLIAGADRRIATMGDQGDIEMMVRISHDNGKTWSDKISIFNIRNSPSIGGSSQPTTMDMALVQDPKTGKIFAFYDLFIEGRGLNGMPKIPEKAYKLIDGKNYQLLYRNEDKAEFTIRENGVVYDANNQATNYRVVLNPPKGVNNDYDTYGDIYEGNRRLGNIYFSTKSMFTVPNTSYIMMSESSDNGQTWSAPKNISDMVRTDDMEFQGIGPGTAIVLKEGKHAGRIVVPTYTRGSVTRLESARVIYSDDNGLTWKSGEAVNDGREVDGITLDSKNFTDGKYQNSEAAVVQLQNGQLKLFLRNRTGKVQIATSDDGGATWGNVLETTAIPEETTQMSAITTLQDGKEYVILVNGGTPRRVNGYAHIAEVKANGVLDWKESRLIQRGQFAYNSIQQIGATEFGLLYEHDVTGVSGNLYYKTMNWEFLKPIEESAPTVSVVSTSLTNRSNIIALNYSDAVIASSDLVLKLANGQTLPLLAQYDSNTLLFKWDRKRDSEVEVVGIASGQLDSLHNYKLNEKTILPHNLEPVYSKENIVFDSYYKGDENLAYGSERTEGGVLGKKASTKTYSIDDRGHVIETTTIVVTDPVARVRVKGTKPRVVDTSTELPTVYEADDTLAYGETKIIAGSPKIERTTTTYEVDATSGVVTPTTTTDVVDLGKPKTIKIGTKAGIVTKELDFTRTYEADASRDLNTTAVKTAGEKGVETTTTTYKLDGTKAVVDQVTTAITKQPVAEVVQVGTKPTVTTEEVAFSTEYVADEHLAYGQTAEVAGKVGTKTITTTYKLEGSKAVADKTNAAITVQPVNKIIKVGIKPTVVTEDVPFGTDYIADNNLAYGQTAEVAGKVGTKKITTTYKLEGSKAIADNTIAAITIQPVNKIVKVGTQASISTKDIAYTTTYEVDASRDLNTTAVKAAGEKGVETTTTTYKLDGTKAVVDQVTTAVTKQPVAEVVQVGTKPTVVTEDVAFSTEYVADATLVYGQTTEVAGKDGTKTITTTYKLEGSKAVADKTSAAITAQPVNKIVKVGIQASTSTKDIAYTTTYEADASRDLNTTAVKTAGEKGVETTTTTYKLDGTKAVVDQVTTAVTKQPVAEVVQVGTKPTVTTEEVSFGTDYVADENLAYGETTEVAGKVGTKTLTTTYKLDGSKAVVDKTSAAITAQPVNKIVMVGTQASTSTKEIAYTTIYEADASRDLNTSVVKTVGEKGVETTTTTYKLEGYKAVVDQVTTAVTKQPVAEVVQVGTKPTVETEEVAFGTDYVADATLAYGETTEVAGKVGTKTLTTTYKLDGSKAVVDKTSAAITAQPVNKIVKVGTQASTSTKEIAYTTTYEEDASRDLNTTAVKTAGEKGVETTTTTYKLEGYKAVVDQVTTAVTKQPVAEVVQVGTKPTITTEEVAFSTEYVADEHLAYGQTAEVAGKVGTKTLTTTYKLDGSKPVADKTSAAITVQPVNKIVKVGTQASTSTKDIAYTTTYEADASRDLNTTAVKTVGEKGVETTTTTYKLDGTKAVVDQVMTAVTKQPVTEVVQVGTKPTVVTEDVSFSTDYVADENLAYGETTEVAGKVGTKAITTTYKLEGSKAVIAGTTEETTTKPQNRVVHVGNVQAVENPITMETTYIADPDHFTSSEIVVEEGQAGISKTTTIYEVNAITGALEQPQTTTALIQAMLPRVIKRGTLAVVATTTEELSAVEETVRQETSETPFTTSYQADMSLDYGVSRVSVAGQTGKKVTTITQAHLNGQVVAEKSEVIEETSPVNAVILVGTKPTTEVTELASPVEYEADATLAYGSQETIAGRTGQRSVTTTYEVNSETGVVTPVAGGPVEVAPTVTIIKVGTKPTVTTEEVAFGTDYVADENLAYGETTEVAGKVGSKTITTNYKLDGSKAVIAGVTEEMTAKPQNRVVHVGNVQTMQEPVAIVTKTIEDSSLAVGQTRIINEGEEGINLRVTRYQVNTSNGRLENPETTVTEVKPMTEKILAVGTKVIYGQVEKRETVEIPFEKVTEQTNLLYTDQRQVKQVGQLGSKVVVRVYQTVNGQVTDVLLSSSEEIFQPAIAEISLVGTKAIQGQEEIVEYVDIIPEIIQREDSSLLKGQTRLVSGSKGQRQVTRLYETIRGVRTDKVLNETSFVLKEAQPTLIYIGTKVISQVPEVAPVQPELPELEVVRKVEEQEQVVSYSTKEILDNTLLEGTRKVLVTGQNGKKKIVTILEYVHQELVRTSSYEEVLESPRTEVVLVGTQKAATLPEIPSTPSQEQKLSPQLAQTPVEKKLPDTGSQDQASLATLGLAGLLGSLGLMVSKKKED